MVYHSNADERMKLHNKTIVICFHYYVVEHKKNSDTIIQSFIYTYTAHVHQFKEAKPNSLVLGRCPTVPIMYP